MVRASDVWLMMSNFKLILANQIFNTHTYISVRAVIYKNIIHLYMPSVNDLPYFEAEFLAYV